MWVLIDTLFGKRNSYSVQHLDRLLPRLLFAQMLVKRDRLHDLVSDCVHRIQRGHRFLEDHGNFVSANRPIFLPFRIERGQILRFPIPVIQDLAIFNLAGGDLNKPHD